MNPVTSLAPHRFPWRRRYYLVLAVLFLLATTSSSTAQPTRLVGEVQTYTTKDGDDLLEVARRFGLAIDHLCFANRWPTNATGIYPGTEVVVPTARVLPQNPPPDGFVINLPERGLYYFRNRQFVRFYPISIGNGEKAPTPTGSFRVVEKIKNPTWYPPSWAKEKGPVGPGPDNPLGDRWIGLSVGRYGIHSTSTPINVGNDVTHGCIRMFPDDLRLLFAEVELGWTVRIEYVTAKIGLDLSGNPYLVTFPDCYHKLDPEKSARALCSRQWTPELATKTRHNTGLPISISKR